MKRVSGLLISLLFSLLSTVSFAEGAKIGVVDLQKIMQTSTQMKGIQEKLEKELTYPGQITVTVIREVRAVDIAK